MLVRKRLLRCGNKHVKRWWLIYQSYFQACFLLLRQTVFGPFVSPLCVYVWMNVSDGPRFQCIRIQQLRHGLLQLYLSE